MIPGAARATSPGVRTVRTFAAMLTVAVVLLAALEGLSRLVFRLWVGAWPQTLAAQLEDNRRATAVLYRRHPYLLTSAREGAHDPREDRIVINSLGYRSPERPRKKPLLVSRVVCAGGSTTWDPWAITNETTWVSQLERRLRASGRFVEVWNSGFPGWTSQENLIALAIRDLELEPDVVVLYQGINDLQPASHMPFSPDYAPFHADMQLSLLGFDVPPLPWYERLFLVERVRALLFGPPQGSFTTNAVPGTMRRTTLVPDAVRVFERNVRSFIALATAHGARVVLATQRFSPRRTKGVRGVLEFAMPDLDPTSAPQQLERLNDVLRGFAARGDADLADVARDVDWNGGDFRDLMHTSPVGSTKLAAALVEPVGRALDAQKRKP